MKVRDSVALITGANRGLGLAFARALVAAGARKVYAGARDPRSIALSDVQPVALDVTNAAQVAAAARACGDVTLLINNAGVSRGTGALAPDGVAAARAELETNFFGPLEMSRAFAPILRANGGGAIVNVLSVLAWINTPIFGTYCASKSAAWSLTNGLRIELRAQHTQVVALHVGLMDTDMAAGLDAPKTAPAEVVRQTLAALEAGREEVLADEVSRQVKLGLSADPGIYLSEPPG
ncbi:MAG TPA: SDR family oxidoreductase [Myxococcota bacterium]|nr:SDR family oxidoreductase [Myxococcota bacterium]